MKSKDIPPQLPRVSGEEVKAWVAKTESVNMRLTAREKEDIRATAESLHLSLTDYLLKCHALVSAKLKDKDP